MYGATPDRDACYQKMLEEERRLIYGYGSTPRFDNLGRPLESWLRSPTWSYAGTWGRSDRVIRALQESQHYAFVELQHQFEGISLADIWPILVEVVEDVAMYIGVPTLVGGTLGYIFAKLPGTFIGATLGFEVGNFLMWFFGVKSLVEYMVPKVPEAFQAYLDGFKTAWGPPPGSVPGDGSCCGEWAAHCPHNAAQDFAHGHVVLAGALLMAMALYLARNKGGVKALAAELEASHRLGKKFAVWLQENEKKLEAKALLQQAHAAAGAATAKAGDVVADAAKKTKAAAVKAVGHAKNPGNGFAHTRNGAARVEGAAAQPRYTWAENANGVKRTPAEAIALAEKWGVQIPEDAQIIFTNKLYNNVGAKAEYSQGFGLKTQKPTDWISWNDLKMANGKIPVRFSNDLLTSDEAIVAHFAHEMFELNKFEDVYRMKLGDFQRAIHDRINGGAVNNWHEQAWDYSDKLIKLMRGD